MTHYNDNREEELTEKNNCKRDEKHNEEMWKLFDKEEEWIRDKRPTLASDIFILVLPICFIGLLVYLFLF